MCIDNWQAPAMGNTLTSILSLRGHPPSSVPFPGEATVNYMQKHTKANWRRIQNQSSTNNDTVKPCLCYLPR